MATFISHSPEETFALGQAWAAEAEKGWVIGLSGDLGAGKTQLVKGLAAGLGVSERVHSPTFGLLNEYRTGRLPLYHLDLYRLNSPAEVMDAGLEEYLLNPDGIAVVEWVERWLGPDAGTFAPPFGNTGCLRYATIETTGENDRRIIYEDLGR